MRGEGAVGVVAGAADRADGVLVLVVADVEDGVQVLVGEVLQGREVAVVVRLAGHPAEAHVTDPGAVRRGGAGAAGGAGPLAGPEAVLVDAVGFEALGVHVHGVVELGVCGGGSAPDHPVEVLVAGDLPLDPDGPSSGSPLPGS